MNKVKSNWAYAVIVLWACLLMSSVVIQPTCAYADNKIGYDQNGIFYFEGEPANWWYYDGKDRYFFQDGVKLTGYGIDDSGMKFFVDGKYANGSYLNSYFKNGEEMTYPPAKLLHNRIRAYEYMDTQYPTGCWLYAACSGLYSAGYFADPPKVLAMLHQTQDPRTGYMGNPRLSNYIGGAYPAAYPKGMISLLKKLAPGAEDITGANFAQIKYEISQGNTVQIWYTHAIPDVPIDSGTGTFFASRSYHSILLTGYDSTGFYTLEALGHLTNVHIPYNEHGNVNSYVQDYRGIQDAYERFGRMAVVYRS